MDKSFSFLRLIKCEKHYAEIFEVGGLFYGDNNPFKRVIPFSMVRLALFFVISRGLRHFLKPLRQTDYVCNLLAGIILGPSVLGRYKPYTDIIHKPTQAQFMNFAGYLALLYYIFITAVKIDSGMLLRATKKVRTIGMLSVLSPFLVITILTLIINPVHFKIRLHIYLFSMQIATTSFTNLAPALEELNLLTTELGQLALPIALINDFVYWCLLCIMILVKSFARNFLITILPLGLVIAFSICVIRPAMQCLIRRTPEGKPVKEVYVICILVGAGVIPCLFDVIAGMPVIGAAFFGLLVPSGPPLGSIVTQKGEMFIKQCLLPFFFLGIGDMVNVYEIKDWQSHAIFQFIIVLGLLVKALAITVPAMAYKMSLRQAFALGFIMCTSGVMQSQFYWSFWLRQRVSIQLSSQLVISNLVVTSVVMPLSLHLYKQTKSSSDDSFKGFELSIQATSTSSKIRILACVDREDEVPGIMTLLNVTNRIQSTPLYLYMVHLNELVGQAAPVLMPHQQKHRRTCKHNGCVHIMNALTSYCNKSNGNISIQLLTLIAPFKSMHEGICRLAQDKMIPLIIVPFFYKNLSQYRRMGSSSNNNLNRRIQAQAPCTVGIFVDRGLSLKQQKQDYSSYHIMVIFFGGEDDREVLSYAAHMVGLPSVSITMLRIVVRSYQSNINEEEMLLDEALIDMFKTEIVNDACAVFREVQVQDWVQAIQVIQALDTNYDLVMVGRRHDENTLGENNDAHVWSENPELGYIGDMLASTDFQLGVISILVMQHCVEFDTEALGNLMLLEDHNL